MQDLAILVGKPHRESLIAWGADATKVRVFVSFLFPDGVRLIRELLKWAPVELTVSTYLRATRKQALLGLVDILKEAKLGGHPLQVRVATGDKDGFHGKVYRFTYGDGTARIVVGSANLSKGGLGGRGEVSLTVAGPEATVPDLHGADLPALIDHAWATTADPAPLVAVIDAYRESEFGGHLGDELYSDVVSFVEVGDSSGAEDRFIKFVASAPVTDLHGSMEGDRSAADEEFIFNPAKNKTWASLATRIDVGDFVFLAWEGKKTLRGYRLLARYQGIAPALKSPQIVLFLRHIPGTNHRGKQAVLKNRMIPREQLPVNVLHLLGADITSAESDE